MSSLSDRLPLRIRRPSAWLGSELARTPDAWRHRLSPSDVAELETATRGFLATGSDVAEVRKESFPLQRFGAYLRGLKAKLLNGIGFEVISGLPVGKYDSRFAATLFCGIGAHLGSARSQNAEGHVLGRVRDLGADSTDVNARIYQTSERQSFHTDSADVVGLLCLRQARSGGDSLLVSAETIYNRMRADRPELVAPLFEPVATDRRGEVPEGAGPFFTIPVLNWFHGLLTVMYQRQYIESAQRFADAPRLSATYVEALDCFDQLANDPRLHISMRLEPGDMQFVYNHSMLHDRTAFSDWEEPARKRHLLRLWLSIDGDRALPACFAERYGSIEIGDRGGIHVPGTTLQTPHWR